MSQAVSKKSDQSVAQGGNQAMVESKEQSASASANVSLELGNIICYDSFDQYIFSVVRLTHIRPAST